MLAVFERPQRSMRAYDNNAPSYQRTHLITSNGLPTRFAGPTPARAIPDTREFHCPRAIEELSSR
jgi:hypothetical protein